MVHDEFCACGARGISLTAFEPNMLRHNRIQRHRHSSGEQREGAIPLDILSVGVRVRAYATAASI